MDIYTPHYNPFVMGGPTTQNVKTHIEEFERVPLGKKRFGALIRNPVKALWHIAEETCGAIIGTNRSRAALLKQVKGDVAQGDPAVMDRQVQQGIKDRVAARSVDNGSFFSAFRGEPRKGRKR